MNPTHGTCRPVFASFWVTIFALASIACYANPSSTPATRDSSQKRNPILEEPRVSDVVQALTMTTVDGGRDCDGNGIADSLDILAGRIEDRNHNGIDDFCDDDSTVNAMAYSTEWKSVACRPDTVYFSAYHDGAAGVWIRYTVPARASSVSLAVLSPSGALARQLVSGNQPCGAYSLTWNKTGRNGKALHDGVEYTLRLRVGGRSLTRKVLWRNAPLGSP